MQVELFRIAFQKCRFHLSRIYQTVALFIVWLDITFITNKYTVLISVIFTANSACPSILNVFFRNLNNPHVIINFFCMFNHHWMKEVLIFLKGMSIM